MAAFSLAVLAAWLAISATLVLGWRRLRSLAALAHALPAPPPRLTVILTALNEERGIEAALRSLLGSDYPGLEIIAIDDRSTDSTGAILDRLAAGHPQLRVLHVRSLPHGWLGKNHALWQGTLDARGDYFLF